MIILILELIDLMLLRMDASLTDVNQGNITIFGTSPVWTSITYDHDAINPYNNERP